MGMDFFSTCIRNALGQGDAPEEGVALVGEGSLRSCFDISGLAIASIQAAASELAALVGAKNATLDRRLALKWFDMTLRPIGWNLPSVWDSVAGDYQAQDGWIRLHTNAPHHRAAALAVLDCASERAIVADKVGRWNKDELEQAIVQAGGCAAAMRDLNAWAHHPQGQAVAGEPLMGWSDVPDLSNAAPGPMMEGLAGVKVLDLTRVLASPVATRFLAAFGAQVLRIDPPAWNEPAVEQEVTSGKRCAELDLHKKPDRQAFEKLLGEADALVHGYRPGALDRLGYGAEARAAANPRLIEVTLNAYGWSGPWAGRRGFDSLVQMSSGIAAEGMIRANAQQPKPLPVQALDHATGYLMAAAVLRALRIRGADGQALTARLSLARTAQLLTESGVQAFSGELSPETDDDIAPGIEHTGWGPARRVVFPLRLSGKLPDWCIPAGALRRHRPDWS